MKARRGLITAGMARQLAGRAGGGFGETPRAFRRDSIAAPHEHRLARDWLQRERPRPRKRPKS